jgi:hypothetical protein
MAGVSSRDITPKQMPDAMKKSLPLLEIARVLVRLDYVARVIVNTNHSIRSFYLTRTHGEGRPKKQS